MPYRLPEISLAGIWTYRSFINDPALVNGNATTLLNMLFAEATMTLHAPTGVTFTGALDFGGGQGMDLHGTITPPTATAPEGVLIHGTGRPNTPTAAYFYDYQGYYAPHWPNGVAQVPTLVGGIIRVKPHDGQPAGYTATFMAIKHP
jgi:hypothetical protein